MSAPAPHPFRPLTDAEYDLLRRHLPETEGRRGRPPADRRRTLDAIFWVACSAGPWKDLPRDLGRADTASRQLRRWARTGHMDLLLALVANRDRRRDRLEQYPTRWNRLVGLLALENIDSRAAYARSAEPRSGSIRSGAALVNGLAWRIARAWRRISRMVGLGSLMLAKRLGVLAALPAAPRHLPDVILSESVHARLIAALKSIHAQPPELFAILARMMRLMRYAGGAPRRWRLR